MFQVASSKPSGAKARVLLAKTAWLKPRPFKTMSGSAYRVVALLLVLTTSAAYARVRHSEAWARDHFATAERMREALNGRPPADRTRRDYQRVINAYRSVYFGAPTSTKADPSVVAVAETLVEMGRRFDDDKILNAAIAQYKFLRKEYPGSKYRCDALFTIGEIYNDDLNDPDQARATFKEFLHRYPHNRLVDDAQQAIAQLDRDAAAAKKVEAEKQSSSSDRETANRKSAETTDISKTASGKDSGEKDSDVAANAASGDDSEAVAKGELGRLPRVTGIRHWSTPDYTRVAIDLESEVKFGSQRIANPDRIFFDLRDTKLASTLVGKSFDVDDGFLKKIRVAQFQPGRTRVVLEVESLSDYEAFLLPNPYRLIIDIHGDIHGKDIHGKGDSSARKTAARDALRADVEVPPKAGSKAETADAEVSTSDVAKVEAAKANAARGEVAKTGISKNVPKTELRADVKALAGVPASKKEQIHEQPKADSDEESTSVVLNDAPEKPHKPRTHEVEVKTPTGTIKKVIVDADDEDDSSAAETAKPEGSTRLSPAKRQKKAESANETATDTAGASAGDASARDASNVDTANAGDAEGASADKSVAASKRGKAAVGSRGSRRSELDAREAQPTASGNRSLIRVLGLKIGKIVIDPGHGGHDTGTIGPDGLEEKDLVLDVGRRLGKLLEARLGAQVVYTRKDDTFIPLETRTAIANQQRADLFISIHANSSHDPDARGVETYYLNFTSSPEALEVAARENAVSEKSIYELQDLVKKIALKEKIEESREFAGDVQESLHGGLALKSPAIRDRGVKKAPFIVLIGANMPSILAEISFVSNPTDERRLETSEYRQRIAESLYRGIAKYADGLSGVKVASNKEKASSQ